MYHLSGCGCAGSEHGCCFDGETQAEGPDFQGCPMTLGETCSLEKVKGMSYSVL